LTHNYFRHKINLATQSLDIQFPGCPSNDWRKAVKISTKWGSAAATALSLGLLVSGLPWGLTAASAADPITINFWHAYSEGGGETNAITNLLIPRFEAEHPGISVHTTACTRSCSWPPQEAIFQMLCEPIWLGCQNWRILGS
jgi:hypothetical protein